MFFSQSHESAFPNPLTPRGVYVYMIWGVDNLSMLSPQWQGFVIEWILPESYRSGCYKLGLQLAP